MRTSHRLLTMVLAVSWIGIVVSGCDSSSEPVADQPTDSSETTPQDAASKTGGIAETIRSQADVNNSTIEASDLPDNVDELMSTLARKQAEQMNTRDPKEFYRIQQYRLAASRKLLGMKINKEQRFEFIKIQLDSLLKLISLGDPQSQHDFQTLISAHATDSQPRVREAVAVAGLVNDFRQRMVRRDPDMQPVVDAAAKTASEFPDSFVVCKELGSIVAEMMQKGDRETAKRMSWALINTYQDSASEPARNYVKQMESQVRVVTSNLDLIVREIRDKRPRAFERYREAIQYLLGDETLGPNSTDPIVASLVWLERSGLIDETLEANHIVTTASLDIKQQATRDRLRQNCGLRETRLGMVGQPFSITGLLVGGQRFDWPAFSAERPVVVVFWAPSEPASVRLIQQLSELPEVQQENGARLLAVSTSADADLANLFPDPPANMAILGGNPTVAEGPSEFISMFGVEQLPQILLVNQSGTVTTVNPRPNTLKSLITDLTKQ